MKRLAATLAGVTLLVLPACTDSSQDPVHDSGQESLQLKASFPPDSTILPTADNIMSLLGIEERTAWNPAVSQDQPRGGIRDVYQTVAPAVAVVRSTLGHGTGFLISDDGMLLTNHHVIEHAFANGDTDTSFVEVYLGQLDDGVMQLNQDALRASIIETDPVRDLALLKLEQLPGSGALPHLSLAARGPRPGDDCIIVGHPSSGMLWTIRQCNVSSLGSSPQDMVNTVTQILATGESERSQLEAKLALVDSRNIILSSCLVNPGDSGGPVVSAQGELLAVTFARPFANQDASFTYHVALSEVRSFLESAGSTPLLLRPEAWDLAPRVGLINERILAAGKQQPNQFLFDLDGDTPRALIDARDMSALVERRQFDPEIAIHGLQNRAVAFYDTDADATMDLVLLDYDPDPAADRRYRFVNGKWDVEEGIDVQLVDPALIPDPNLQREFQKQMGQLQAAQAQQRR